MFKKDEKKMTIENVVKKVQEMGLETYQSADKTLTVVYGYFDIDYNVFHEIIHFQGEEPYQIYKKVFEWVNNKDLWVNMEHFLILDIPKSKEIDLQYELLNMGFKYADIEFEMTNFVTVDCRYCYRNKGGEFKYDGKLQFDNKGNISMTLEFIKVWINKFSKHYPGCTFEATVNSGVM